MLLILSNSKDVTCDYLAPILTRNSVPFFRFDTDISFDHIQFRFESDFPEVLIDGVWRQPSDFKNVWYRRPERPMSTRIDDTPDGRYTLSEWAAAFEGFLAHIPLNLWMNHPATNVAASHKIQQLTTASRLGFLIPDTLITQDSNKLHAFFRKHHGKIIAKPLSTGYVDRHDDTPDSLIFTNEVAGDDLQDLQDLALCPTLFQQAIQKQIDVRITIVDDAIHAVELRGLEHNGTQRCDIRRNNMADVEYRAIELPHDIEGLVRSLMQEYQLRYAAIDMAIDLNGKWVFFEINPNGQWAWLDIAGGANIASSFVRSFSTALSKIR
jgi:hypothetical protein